jgi:transcriptional regulator with PAS, ATPase and Fis domain
VIPVDVRVITATNKDLSSEVQQGAFREDLFYRLDVLELELPPLRQRKQDIPRLLEYFLDLEREKHACVLTDISPTG